jgi:hypothetical protein
LVNKPYLLPFTYPPDVRENFFISDAWAIAEAYGGFCVGFTYPPDPAVCDFFIMTNFSEKMIIKMAWKGKVYKNNSFGIFCVYHQNVFLSKNMTKKYTF